MVRVSDRQHLLSCLYKLAKYCMFFDDEEGYDEMLEMIALVEGTRYMQPKFMNLKKHLRMNRTFSVLTNFLLGQTKFRSTCVRVGLLCLLVFLDQ